MKIIQVEYLSVGVNPRALYFGGPKFEFKPHDGLLTMVISVETCHTYR
jgi:hypothetical protein